MNGGAVTYSERRLMDSTVKLLTDTCTLGDVLVVM
jgi:hypothetical protein